MDKPLKTIFHIDEQEYKKVYEKISPLLNDNGEKEWLFEATKPIA